MSRIGKLPITIPSTVNIIYEGQEITVKGKFGTLSRTLPETLTVTFNDKGDQLIVQKISDNRSARVLQGLFRALLNNMVIGVEKLFELTLNLVGVGYRANVAGKDLVLNLGYSHPVIIPIPDKITIEVIKGTTIRLTSFDNEALGLFAAKIRSWRPPEPYKGKGILFENETIIRKAGKSGKK